MKRLWREGKIVYSGKIPSGAWTKGHTAWNKNKHTKLNNALEKWRKNGGISRHRKGQIPWNKGKRGMQIAWNKNKSHLAIKGENNPNWNGGSSFEPYGLEFNEILKKQVRNRDNYTCQKCKIIQTQLKYKMHVHHIDYNKKNNELINLITLCRNCHIKTNYNRKQWIVYFKDIMRVRESSAQHITA